jgi:hypothetical protein
MRTRDIEEHTYSMRTVDICTFVPGKISQRPRTCGYEYEDARDSMRTLDMQKYGMRALDIQEYGMRTLDIQEVHEQVSVFVLLYW